MFCNLIVQPLVSFHSSRLACLALPSPWHKIGWCMQGFSPKCGYADVKFCTRQIIEVSCHSCFNRFKHALKKRFLQVQSTRNCFLADMFCWKLFKYRNFGILFRLWSCLATGLSFYLPDSQGSKCVCGVVAGRLMLNKAAPANVVWHTHTNHALEQFFLKLQNKTWSNASRMLDPSMAKCQPWWHFAPANVAGLQCVYFLPCQLRLARRSDGKAHCAHSENCAKTFFRQHDIGQPWCGVDTLLVDQRMLDCESLKRTHAQIQNGIQIEWCKSGFVWK